MPFWKRCLIRNKRFTTPAPWWTANSWSGLNFQPIPKTRTRRKAERAGWEKIRWDETE